jgi:hypothetical protein
MLALKWQDKKPAFITSTTHDEQKDRSRTMRTVTKLRSLKEMEVHTAWFGDWHHSK